MSAAPMPGERRRNPYGTASIVLAVIVVALAIVSRILTQLAPLLSSSLSLPIGVLGGVFSALGIVTVLVALAAAAVGLVGVTRPGLPHGVAAAGLGIGLTAAASTVLIFLANLLVAASTPLR